MCSIKVDRVTLAVSVAACVGCGTYGLYFGSKSKSHGRSGCCVVGFVEL